MKQSMCSISLQELAKLLGAKLVGDPRCIISGVATLEKAERGQLSFLTNRSYRKYLAGTKASAVILSQVDVENCDVPVLISENPRLSLAKAAAFFAKTVYKAPPKGIHPSAVLGAHCTIAASATVSAHCVIGDNVSIGENVVLGAGCVVGNDCSINAGTVIQARVTMYDRIRIGQNCLIHSGAVIGADGFGFAHHEGGWVKLPHIGGVSIGNEVEIGANTTIDRGFLEDTQIGNGVIIDNLVLIGHNVVIGDRCAIAGCTAIAGSTTLGAGCMIGGGASIAGHIELADNVHITATTGVNHSLNTAGVYSSGLSAKPNHIWRRNTARFHYLDDMAKRLRALEHKVQVIARTTEEE
jgi:UDP-3-O-[3-hydroxymyristoyl] glucosamine N-acyltransferase